jgi:hypothetical protein
MIDKPFRTWLRVAGGIAAGVGLGLTYSVVSRALGST